MKKIILCPNPNRDRGMEATRRADAILREMGFQTVVCPPFKDQKDGAYGDYKTRPLTAELKSADLLITFGGDGTILHLAKLVALNKIPVLGINMGGLGFIAELEAGELEALRKLKDWDFQTEQRMMLDVTVQREGRQIYTNLGLNDAVIREGPISHVIHLKISSDGRHLADIAGDGVIVATPTGSTAYSLSAGGPVVEPVAQTMVVCPICTHNMRFSSYVLSPEHTLTIELERNGRKPVYLFVDESRAFSLKADGPSTPCGWCGCRSGASARSLRKKCCQEDLKMKNDRQSMILEIISQENIETQEQLLSRLQERGITSTQATISRDIKQMHLIKEPVGHGVYKYAVSGNRTRLNFAEKLRTIFRESITSIDSAQNIVVIKTMPGLASAACAALDDMGVTYMVGSLAGDDTAFLVMRDTEAATDFCQEIKEML